MDKRFSEEIDFNFHFPDETLNYSTFFHETSENTENSALNMRSKTNNSTVREVNDRSWKIDYQRGRISDVTHNHPEMMMVNFLSDSEQVMSGTEFSNEGLQVAFLQSIQKTVAETESLPNIGSLVGFLDKFKHTYHHMHLSKMHLQQNQWLNEANSVFLEIERLRMQTNSSSSVWPMKSSSDENDANKDEAMNTGSVIDGYCTKTSLLENPAISNIETDENVLNIGVTVKLSPIGSRRDSNRENLRRLNSYDSGYRSKSESTDSEYLQDAFSPIKQDPFSDSMPSCIPWSTANYCTDTGKKKSCFTENNGHISMTCSTGESKSTNYQRHKKWITEEILEMIAVRDKLYKRMKKHPSPDIVNMYKKVRNMVVGMTRNAKRAYEKKEESTDLYYPHRAATASKDLRV